MLIIKVVLFDHELQSKTYDHDETVWKQNGGVRSGSVLGPSVEGLLGARWRRSYVFCSLDEKFLFYR